MATLFESYVLETSLYTWGAWGTRWDAQTFTPSTGHTLIAVYLYLKKQGSPGTVTVSIRATSGGVPVDNDLATASTFDGNGLTTSFVWTEIDMNDVVLVAGTMYAIVIRAMGSSQSADQVLYAARRQTNGETMYGGGSVCDSSNSGSSWIAYDDTGYGDDDALFKEYGVGYPSDSVARVSSIRHIFRPGFFRMQVGLGDLGFDVDIVESTVRKALDTAKEVEPGPGYPEILEVLGMTAEEFAKMGREISARRRVSTDFSAYKEQIAYEEWFQKQMEELRRMQE